MKARFGTRMMLTIVGIVILIISLAAIGTGLMLDSVTLTKESTDLVGDISASLRPAIGGPGYFTLRRVVLLALGAVLLLCSLFILSVPRRIRYNRKEFIVQESENGELRIAVQAVENLVKKCTDMHDEINVLEQRVTNHRDGVVVDLRVSLPNNISIPLAIESLQKQIRQYLTVSTGVSVKEVRVAVVNTENSLVKESPYEVGETAERAEEKKAPHERVFESEEPEPEPAPQAEAPQPEAEEAQAEPAAEEAPVETAEGDAPVAVSEEG
ncbi:MAG: alkaline shock response membrane anchor protein AmaP [Clostridia bacterium]|nr:alkaline shock response membrane anchor protein AmaP [Clostridia bacterium]